DDEGPFRQDERRSRREARAADRDPDGAGPVSGRELRSRSDVEDDRVAGRFADAREGRLRPNERTAVELDDPLHVRGAWRWGTECGGDEVGKFALERVIEAPLEAD